MSDKNSSLAQNLEIFEKLTSLCGSTFLFGYIERKKYQFFEPTCAYARWALMHRFLYVCHLTKIHKLLNLGSNVTWVKVKSHMG